MRILLFVCGCFLADSSFSSLWHSFEAASREDLQGLSHNIEAPSDILEYKHFLKPKTIPTSFDSGVIIEQAPLLFSKADFSTEKYGLNEKSLARSSGVVPKAAMKDGEKGYNSICYSNSDKAQISKGKEQCLNQHKFNGEYLNRLRNNQLERPTAQLSGIKPLINSIPPGNNEESAPGFLKGRYLDKGENTLKENFHWSRHSNFFLDEFDKQFSQLEYPDRNILGQGNNYEECFIDNSKNMDFNFYPQQTKTPNDSYGLVSQPEKDWKYIPMEQVAISNFDEIDGDSLWISELVGGKTIGELHQAYSQLELINSPMEKTDSLPNLHVTGFEEYPSPKVPHQIKESESYKLAWIEDSGLDVLSGKRGKNKAAASKDKSNNDQDNLQKEDKSFEPVTSVDLIPKNKDETLIQELQDLIQREDLVLSSKFFNEKVKKICGDSTISDEMRNFFEPYHQAIQGYMRRKNTDTLYVEMDKTEDFFSKRNFIAAKFETTENSNDKIFGQIIQKRGCVGDRVCVCLKKSKLDQRCLKWIFDAKWRCVWIKYTTYLECEIYILPRI